MKEFIYVITLVFGSYFAASCPDGVAGCAVLHTEFIETDTVKRYFLDRDSAFKHYIELKEFRQVCILPSNARLISRIKMDSISITN